MPYICAIYTHHDGIPRQARARNPVTRAGRVTFIDFRNGHGGETSSPASRIRGRLFRIGHGRKHAARPSAAPRTKRRPTIRPAARYPSATGTPDKTRGIPLVTQSRASHRPRFHAAAPTPPFMRHAPEYCTMCAHMPTTSGFRPQRYETMEMAFSPRRHIRRRHSHERGDASCWNCPHSSPSPSPTRSM